MLAAGRLRQRVNLMRNAKADNGKGGYTSAWSAVASSVPAEVLGLTGSEVIREKSLQGIRCYRITLRWRQDLQPKDQLRYGTEDLNVRSAVDPDGRREQLVILADTDGAVATS
ncbi:MAG TPA: phage head closure protein [Sphingomonas sp.]|jgi:SPP1 family predicted phage head-tail adaptor